MHLCRSVILLQEYAYHISYSDHKVHREISFGRRKGYSDVYEQMVEAYSSVSLQTRALLVVLRIHKYVQVTVKLGKEIQGP